MKYYGQGGRVWLSQTPAMPVVLPTRRTVVATFCAYCARKHNPSLTSCEGCGAPVMAARPHIETYIERNQIETTTHSDSKPTFVLGPPTIRHKVVWK